MQMTTKGFNFLRLILIVAGVSLICFFTKNLYFPKRHSIKLISMFDDGNTRVKVEIQNFAQEVKNLTNIDIKIVPYNKLPKQLPDSNDILKAVSEGTEYQMAFGSPYYWIKKIPEAVFFASVPFGMHHEALSNWVSPGKEGRNIWDSIYLNNGLDLKPFPFGMTGGQWGGISSKEIKTLEDFKGMYFRMPGLGGEVIKELGGIPFETGKFSISTSKIEENARSKECDKFIDWIGVKEDKELVLRNWAFCEGQEKKLYYYTNGWHERNTLFELLINRTFYEQALDGITRERLASIIEKYNYIIFSYYPEMNELEYSKIRYLENGQYNDIQIKFIPFSANLLSDLKNVYEKKVLREYLNKNKYCIPIFEKYKAYMEKNDDYYQLNLRDHIE